MATAGNASGLNDGAAAMVLASADAAGKAGLKPRARILGDGHGGVRHGHRIDFSSHSLLQKTSMITDLFDVIENDEGCYFTGDGCRRDDEDGEYWITGRVEDVINVSGHRLGTAEVESALVAHPKVAEAAVVGYPHQINGQGTCCYVMLMNDQSPSDDLRKERRTWVRTEIGPIATPGLIQWAPGLLWQDHASYPAKDR